MGYTGQIIAARGVSAIRFRKLGLEPAEGPSARGWLRAWGEGITADLDELLVRVAAQGKGVAIGAWVFDSDVAQVIALGPDGERAALMLGRPYEDMELEHDPKAFARWSKRAPKKLSIEAVDAVAARDDVFAEETVEELLEQLGLPVPYVVAEDDEAEDRRPHQPARATVDNIGAAGLGGYAGPLRWMTDRYNVGGSVLPWTELPYVPGAGRGSIGIWDRTVPDAPVETFRASQRGESELHDRLRVLLAPVRGRVLRTDVLNGFEELVDYDTVRVVGRDLSVAHARFVLGLGDRYMGIWDRARPDEPIERFPVARKHQDAARSRVDELLVDELASAKRTDGVRLYLPTREERRIEMTPSPETMERLDPVLRASVGRMWSVADGAPLLILEEDIDEIWEPLPIRDGRFHLYRVGGRSGRMHCLSAFASVEDAQAYAERVEHRDEPWRPVDDDVERTLLGALVWAEQTLDPPGRPSYYSA